MVEFPDSTISFPISKLSILEVLDFVDGPKLFSSVSTTGQIFLTLWIGEDDTDSTWLYVPVSHDRYSAIKSGNLDLRSAYLQSESGEVIYVEVNSNGLTTSKSMPTTFIDEDWLPVAGDTLNLPSGTLPDRLTSAKAAAQSTNQNILDLMLQLPNAANEISLRALSAITYRLQLLVDALGTDQARNVRKVAANIKHSNSLTLREVFAGSFGMRIAQSDDQLFGNQEATLSLDHFLGLLQASVGFESARDTLLKFNLLSRSRYLAFLEQLIRSQASVEADFGSYSGSTGRAKLTLPQIRHIYAALEQLNSLKSRDFVSIGQLDGVDVHTKEFDFLTEERDRITGFLSKSLYDEEFMVPLLGSAGIRETVVYHEISGKEEFKYELLTWDPDVDDET